MRVAPSVTRRLARLLLAATLTGAAAPAPAPARTAAMVCYLRQIDNGRVVDFVRYLDFDAAGTVGIADNLGAGFVYLGRGRVVRSDKTELVFDFASPMTAGRTEIDRRTGAFRYSGGGFTFISGTCAAPKA